MSRCRLAPLGSILDPRPESESIGSPFAGAVNIPAGQLLDRLHELPSKDELVTVADAPPYSEEARRFLRRGGRRVAFAAPEPGTAEPRRLWKPNAFLEAVLPQLAGARALDLGCGSGREALAMAAAGFSVAACDNLPDALERGRGLARRYLDCPQPPIEWLLRDVEASGPPEGRFDLITSFRFLHRPLLARIHEHLAPCGSLLVETFTTLHRARHGKPRSDHHILQLGELPSLVPGLEVVQSYEGWRGESHTARLWARPIMG